MPANEDVSHVISAVLLLFAERFISALPITALLALNVTLKLRASFRPRFETSALTKISFPVIGVVFETLKEIPSDFTSRSGPGSTSIMKYDTAPLSALSVARTSML